MKVYGRVEVRLHSFLTPTPYRADRDKLEYIGVLREINYIDHILGPQEETLHSYYMFLL
jgi:hypothetical protein